MEKYVTQEECEARRSDMFGKIDENTEHIAKLYGQMSAVTTEIQHITKIIAIELSLLVTITGGLILWALTK